ncbi:ATP-binding protein [Litchfieldia salsa]|uniref:histidine kinase n=1 Tax=Litchfieldia salsa TaxID=930152 RepID=A0A1H0UUF1_9BACI|nr:ATP-binding protein [Litchfieldia salsa]SDP69731.1 PAS domain S-box-containing protein [Litchfieldia salsa]
MKNFDVLKLGTDQFYQYSKDSYQANDQLTLTLTKLINLAKMQLNIEKALIYLFKEEWVLESKGEKDGAPIFNQELRNLCLSVKNNHEMIVINESNDFKIEPQRLGRLIGHPLFLAVLPIIINEHCVGTLSLINYASTQYGDSEKIVMEDYVYLISNQLIMVQMEQQHRKNTQALIESEELFRQMAENIQEALWIYDFQQKKILYISPAWEDIWGRPIGDYYENPWLWDESIHPEDKGITKLVQNIKGNTVVEYRIQQPDGSVKWIKDRMVPIYNSEGQLCKLTGIAEEITEAKINEDLLRKFDKLTAVGQLAASFAHEIRNPLTSIKGFIQIQKEAIEPYFNLIDSEFKQIECIINEFLFLAKPNQEDLFQTQDLIEILNEVLSFLKIKMMFSNVKVVIDFPYDTLCIWCERSQLKQVFINVLNNSIEAMEKGGNIEIKIRKTSDSHYTIEIIDEGIGISNDRIERLGEPFYSNKEKGSGLGLMVSYKIIENHCGSIKIKSEVNKGTSVLFTLPFKGSCSTEDERQNVDEQVEKVFHKVDERQNTAE